MRFSVNFKFISLCFFLLFLSHCGSDDSSQLSENEIIESQPYVVILGGNQSCSTDDEGRAQSPFGTGLYPHFKEMIGDIFTRTGLNIQYTASCYGESATVRYATGLAPEVIISATREEFTTHLMEEVGADQNLFLAGHSYGGWLAMKGSLDLVEMRMIKGLFTIDPISRETCTFSQPFGCTEAPSDIDTSERNQLQDGTDLWANFYQTQTWYLHSAAISQADENKKLNTSHTTIDDHEDVWNRLKDSIENYY